MGKIHFLNVGCADASVIRTLSGTFLIDCYGIKDYPHLLPASKNLSGVFITHQHKDHYSGLGYLKDKGYTIDNLIYSPYKRRKNDQSVTNEEWDEFNEYRDYFKRKGTKLYAPYRQSNFDKPYWETDGVSFYIIGPAKDIAVVAMRELHDACLVIHAVMGNHKCLFTGDASNANLKWIADNTKNYCNDILHASHHGSIHGADLDFIKKCNPDYTVVSTESGVHENVPHPVAMRRYRNNTRKEVCRTDQDGDLELTF